MRWRVEKGDVLGWTPSSKVLLNSLIFIYLGLLNIMSGVKAGVLLWSGIRHIMFLVYWNFLSFPYKACSHHKETILPLRLIVMMTMIGMGSSNWRNTSQFGSRSILWRGCTSDKTQTKPFQLINIFYITR